MNYKKLLLVLLGWTVYNQLNGVVQEVPIPQVYPGWQYYTKDAVNGATKGATSFFTPSFTKACWGASLIFTGWIILHHCFSKEQEDRKYKGIFQGVWRWFYYDISIINMTTKTIVFACPLWWLKEACFKKGSQK